MRVFSSSVRNGEGLEPTSVPIEADEEIRITFTDREGPDEVEVYSSKTCTWDGKE